MKESGGRGGSISAQRMVLCTRSKSHMIGSATSDFHIPAGFDSTHESGNYFFILEISPGWSDNDWLKIKYTDIICMPYWSILLADKRRKVAVAEAEAARLARIYCIECIKDVEAAEKRKNVIYVEGFGFKIAYANGVTCRLQFDVEGAELCTIVEKSTRLVIGRKATRKFADRRK